MIYVKKHESDMGAVLAMCDEELLGKVIEEGDKVMDLKTYSKFYEGELVPEEKAAEELGSSIYSANIVGKRAVGIIIEAGLADEAQVLMINGVKILQIFSV